MLIQLSKGSLVVPVAVVLVVLVVCTSASAHGCGGFTHRPFNHSVPEGTNVATFSCHHPEAIDVTWLINGEPISALGPDQSDILTNHTDRSGGGRVSTLSIPGRRDYNETKVTCVAVLPPAEFCHVNATLFVEVPPGPVDNLRLLPTANELELTWEHPIVTANYTIVYCIDVYRIVDQLKSLIHTECGVDWLSYTFRTNETNPSDLFEFIVTPRYDVEGTPNGTSKKTSGYFTGGPEGETTTAIIEQGETTTAVTVLDIPIMTIVVPVIGVAAVLIFLTSAGGVLCVRLKYVRDHARRPTAEECIEHDPTFTVDNLMMLFGDSWVRSRWHDLGKELLFPPEQLESLSSMEDILTCYTTDCRFKPNWSTICHALKRMGENVLASEVYTRYVLPKETKKQEQSDSGIYTQSTSIDINNDRDNHIPPEGDERVEFDNPLFVHDTTGSNSAALTPPFSLEGPSTTESPEDQAQREMHGQATSTDTVDNYKERLLDMLSIGSASSHNLHGEPPVIHDDDGVRDDIGTDSGVILFQNSFNSDDQRFT